MKTIFLTIVTILLTSCSASAKDNFRGSYNMNRAYEEASKGNNTEAIEFLNKEVKENPKNGYAYLGMATIYFEQNQYDEVFDALSKAYKNLPKKDKTSLTAYHLLKGKTLLATTDTISALSELALAEKLVPESYPDIFETRGQVYYEQGKYDLADKNYRRLIQLNPGDEMGYMGLGRDAQAQNKHDEAITIFDKVVSMYPEYSSAYSFRGESFLKKGEYLKAIDDVCHALEIDSDSKAFGLLFQFPKEQVELVATKLKGLSAKNPHTGEYYYYTGLMYEHHKMYDKSNEALKKGYDVDARPIFIQQLAQNSQNAGNYKTALAYIDETQQLMPDDIDLIHMKADMLGESGDIDGAIAEWSRYIEKSPDYFGGYYRRGWFKDLSMQTDAAIEDYKMAVMLQPDYAYAHLGLADMLMRKGEFDKAKEEYGKVIELDTIPNGDACAMYALLALDRKEDAIAFMNKVLENDSTDRGSFYDAACFYTRIGDLPTAMSHLRKALDLGFCRFYHIRHDDDLEPLRKLPEFEEIMAKYEVKKEAQDIPTNIHVSVDSILSDCIEVPFTPDGGCASVKCSINDLPLTFIFDTGASIVSLSQTEANFMLKNGYLTTKDFVGKGRFVNADGDISEGTIINLREVDFGGLKLKDVRASVVKNQKAPLLLGQTVLGRLGKIEIDNKNKKLVIIPSI